MSFALEVTDLRKSYTFRTGLFRKRTVVPALQGVTFKVKKGEIFGLLGPNGAGKSTTINIISGIVHKDAGKILFFGQDMDEETKNKMNVATAYAALMHNLTIVRNLRVFARIYNVKNSEEKIEELLKRFGIHNLKDKKFYQLSSGEKTRANLCKGLINNPEVLLLDEATVGLDPDIAQSVRDTIKSLDTTIIFTSHMMAEVEELCNRVGFLYQGKILKVGTPKKLTKLIPNQFVTLDFYPTAKNIARIIQKSGAKIVEMKGTHIVLQTPHADQKLHDILQPIFRYGLKIRDLAIEKPSLEDVFLHIAKK